MYDYCTSKVHVDSFDSSKLKFENGSLKIVDPSSLTFKSGQSTVPDILKKLTDEIKNENEKPIKVIFHDPATIAYWPDGKKTVAKCMHGDKYDPEIGLIICYMHRFAPKSFKSDIRKFVSKEYKSAKKVGHGTTSFVWVTKHPENVDSETKEK